MSKVLLNILRSSIRTNLRNAYRRRAESASSSQYALLAAARNLSNVDSTITSGTKKKTKEVVKITLLQQNQLISVTTLEEAQKLARRRDLKLLKMQDLDPKSQRPVYRLAKAADLLSEDSNDTKSVKFSSSANTTKKSVKSLTLNTRISDNDLAARLKNITKWLSKGHDIQALIQGSTDNDKDAERIIQKIEAAIKEPQVIGRITQKRSKDGIVRFNIIPVRVPVDEAAVEQA